MRIRQTRMLACACAAFASAFTLSTFAAETAPRSQSFGPGFDTTLATQTVRTRPERRFGSAAEIGNDGQVRPLVPRSFNSLSQAEEENGQSRIYLGIHWEFDKTEGIKQGRRVANYVYRNAFQPVR